MSNFNREYLERAASEFFEARGRYVESQGFPYTQARVRAMREATTGFLDAKARLEDWLISYGRPFDYRGVRLAVDTSGQLVEGSMEQSA